MVVPGASLLQLISPDEIWVCAWVDETAMTGARDRINPRASSSAPNRAASYPGKVSRLGRETDRETREFLVDVRVKELPKNWTIGQRAEVFIETGRKTDAVLLPPAFRWREGARAGVFVNDGGKAQWREVTLGLRGKDTSRSRRGLRAGEQVVRPCRRPESRRSPTVNASPCHEPRRP